MTALLKTMPSRADSSLSDFSPQLKRAFESIKRSLHPFKMIDEKIKNFGSYKIFEDRQRICETVKRAVEVKGVLAEQPSLIPRLESDGSDFHLPGLIPRTHGKPEMKTFVREAVQEALLEHEAFSVLSHKHSSSVSTERDGFFFTFFQWPRVVLCRLSRNLLDSYP